MFELDGKAIRLLMIEKQMTILDLAKAAGISPVTALKIARGAKANGKTTGKLVSALGVAPQLILKEAN